MPHHLKPRYLAALLSTAVLFFCLYLFHQIAHANGITITAAAVPQLPGVSVAIASPTCPPIWRVEPSPNPSSDNHLFSVTAISTNDVWAVGYYSDSTGFHTLVEHWDGTSWSIVPSPNQGLYDSILFAVDAIGPNDIWAVGYYVTMYDAFNLTMHWNGTAWTIVPSPNFDTGFNRLFSVSALASNDVWAAGSNVHASVEQVAAIHWDGTQWTLSDTIKGFYTPETFYGVEAVAANDVWAVGTAASNTLVEHWNGTSWSEIPAPSPGYYQDTLFAIDALAPNDIWAVGRTHDGAYFRPFVVRWNGTAWNNVPVAAPPATHSIFRGVSALAPNDIWAVGYAEQAAGTLIEHWDGTSWSIVSSPGPGLVDNVLYGVTAISSTEVVAVGIFDHTAGDAPQTLIERYSSSCPTTQTPTVNPTSTTSSIPSSTSTHTLPSPTGTPPRTPTHVNLTATGTPTGTPTPLVSTPTATPTATSTACSLTFSDVPEGHTFYAHIRCLACRNMLAGYPDGTFRPNNEITRGQLSKIVANAAGFTEPASGQTFTDVPPGHTFYSFIQRMANRGIMDGYPDGTFRPGTSATRGQIAKIVSNAANFTEPVSGQRFSDIPPGSTFYVFIERLAARNILTGYPDGTFRPANNATRGQVSKITANTFYPNCATP